jgi:predicted nucleic acid-binding protein
VACLVDTNILVRLAVPSDPHHLNAADFRRYGVLGIRAIKPEAI